MLFRSVENPYEFLCNYDYSIRNMKPESSPEDYWADLMVRVINIGSVKDAILEVLNLQEFDSVAIISRWDYLLELEQWYVWLWFQLNSSDEYAAAIIGKLSVKELSSAPSHISNDIIYYFDSHPEWIIQRQDLVKGLIAITPSQEFFEILDKKDPEMAIGLLTAKTIEEKAYIIKTICRWLRVEEEGIADKIAKVVVKVYPEFAAYFRTERNLYGEYTDYFEWYKRKKIINRPVEKTLQVQDIDFLETRSYMLAKYNNTDCVSYWIDGLGIEWVSLICYILDKNQGDTFWYSSDMAKCVIPSETVFNEQWKLNTFDSIKRNRLDIISHEGMPDDKDYFLAIANQIQVISEMVTEAIQQLRNHEYVIITGDHGSSRLAALAFHQQGLIVPKGAKSMGLGRFCLLKSRPEGTDYVPENSVPCVINDEYYLVMKNYDHFIQPGNAAGGNTDENAVAGEVHGGMTPEECIIPIIVLHRKKKPIQLEYRITARKIISTGGKGSISIEFNACVQSLQVKTDNGLCECLQEEELIWSVKFTNLIEGEAVLEIIADNQMLFPETKLPVEPRGLKKNDMGLGGLP